MLPFTNTVAWFRCTCTVDSFFERQMDVINIKHTWIAPHQATNIIELTRVASSYHTQPANRREGGNTYTAQHWLWNQSFTDRLIIQCMFNDTNTKLLSHKSGPKSPILYSVFTLYNDTNTKLHSHKSGPKPSIHHTGRTLLPIGKYSHNKNKLKNLTT